MRERERIRESERILRVRDREIFFEVCERERERI